MTKGTTSKNSTSKYSYVFQRFFDVEISTPFRHLIENARWDKNICVRTALKLIFIDISFIVKRKVKATKRLYEIAKKTPSVFDSGWVVCTPNYRVVEYIWKANYKMRR